MPLQQFSESWVRGRGIVYILALYELVELVDHGGIEGYLAQSVVNYSAPRRRILGSTYPSNTDIVQIPHHSARLRNSHQ